MGIGKFIKGKVRTWREDRSLPEPTVSEKESIDILRKDVRLLRTQSAITTDFWAKKRNELFDKILSSDPRNFTNWEVMYPMFYNPDPCELDELRRSPYWEQFKTALKEDKLGNPAGSPLLSETSGNLIHHGYSLMRYMLATGIKPDDLTTILEFGGGYGSFCRLAYRMGFKGNYIIFDLPEYSIFQRYFLSGIGLNKPLSVGRIDDTPGTISLISEIDHLPQLHSTSLFVGMWSISETPYDLRKKVLARTGIANSFLLAYQDNFYGVANGSFFEELAGSFSKGKAISCKIAHMPGNNYLFI